MNSTPSNLGRIRGPQSEHGIALILTLSILVMVTLLVIAFAVSMRVEQTASANFNDVIRARQVAQGAVDQAVAQLRAATTPPNNFPFDYATSPGVVYQNNNATPKTIPLVSAPATGSDTNNLNDSYEITGQDPSYFNNLPASAITVNWLYVGQDGSIGPQPIATTSAPIVGRFAYWVDDEASKININSAGTVTPSTDPYQADSSPWDVALSLLSPALGANAANIFQQRQSGTFPYAYTTPQEVLRASSSLVYGDYNANQFYITTFSNDAGDLDVLGRPRRALSGPTGVSVASDITDTSTNGAYGRMSDPTLGTVYSSGNFLDKYSANGVKQLIANIIAYQQDPTALPPPDGHGEPPVYLGLGKTPYINEVQISYTYPTATQVTRTVSVELFYKYDGTYAPSGDSLLVTNLPVVAGLPLGDTIAVSGSSFSTNAVATTYIVFSAKDGPVTITPPQKVQGTAAPTNLKVTYFRPYGGTAQRLDYAEIQAAPLTLDSSTGPSLVWGAQVADPCVNDTPGQWQSYTSPQTGTLGGPNVLPSPPSGGTTTTYPFGIDVSKDVIRGANMHSVGELGYIHTPTAWQHLRLQPQPTAEQTAGMIPDWAVLDLFTASNSVSGAQSPTLGRININSDVSIFPGTPPNNVGRYVPLLALLTPAVPTGVDPAAIAQNIYARSYVNYPNGTDPYGNPNAYDTIGEICEVQGMTNGPPNQPATQASSEAIIRKIANLITVRSNTFTIWAVGQSIKKVDKNPNTQNQYLPAAGDFISGESKLQVVVERVVDSSNNVQFRTLYSRYINQ
jgi:hypothetical protein